MRFELFQDGRGEWRWHLLARNGKFIAESGEGYKRRRDALNAIDRVRRSKDAIIIEREDV